MNLVKRSPVAGRLAVHGWRLMHLNNPAKHTQSDRNCSNQFAISTTAAIVRFTSENPHFMAFRDHRQRVIKPEFFGEGFHSSMQFMHFSQAGTHLFLFFAEIVIPVAGEGTLTRTVKNETSDRGDQY
ncbi:MAG: hypothetical protein JWM11_7579 [Planctomycetaceae bacterium]|nr:hypothetical protein [Planctomycetaceae bacterium]